MNDLLVGITIRGVLHSGWLTEPDLAKLRQIMVTRDPTGSTSIILYEGPTGGKNTHLQFRSALLDSVKM